MRIVIWIISLIAMGYAGYIVWQPLKVDLDQMENDKAVSKPLVMQKARFNDFTNGEKKWMLLAEIAKVFHDEEVVLLYAISGELYSAEKKGEMSRLYANQGHINGKTKVISLEGDVQLYFDNGDSLFTEQLIMDRQKQLIYNERRLKFLHQNSEVKADALRYEIKTEKMFLKNPLITLAQL